MQLKFYKLDENYNESITEKLKLDGQIWTVSINGKELRFKNTNEYFLINKGLKAKLDKYEEFFPHVSKDKCRVCENTLNSHLDDDGLCEKCWDKIIDSYYINKESNSIGKTLVLNIDSNDTITKDELINVINSYCLPKYPEFKIKKTAGLQRLGSIKYKRDLSCLESLTYSHLIPVKSQISTLLHEFTHIYSFMNLTRCELKDEILTQKVEVYLYNYYFSNSKSNPYMLDYLKKYNGDILDYKDDLAKDIAFDIIKIIKENKS